MKKRIESDEGKGERLRVLIASPEIYPIARTGGLGDVAGALPKALYALGHDVRVVMPRYKRITKWDRLLADIPVKIHDYPETAVIKETTLDGKIPAYLVENYRYFDRDDLYGYGDDFQRFAFFSKAVLEMLKVVNWKPDIIHCNDWQSALIIPILKVLYAKNEFFKDIHTAFSIHNLQYQGNFPKETIGCTSLPWDVYTMDKMEFYGQLSYLKGGIVYSDVVNTVSENYAKEIQTKEYGCGLDGLLTALKHKLYGVINGIDYDIWDPRIDSFIPRKYWINTLSDKLINKIDLQREVGLKQDPNTLLIGMISRLSAQKGIDILLPIVSNILKKNVQLVLLGTGDKYYEDQVFRIKDMFPNGRFVLKFDERLSHKIYAGSDLFLIPSKYEPCGLTQMISLRYGTVPLGRETGGLADTIVDYGVNRNNSNGFLFKNYTPTEFENAINRAFELYKNKKEWNELQKRGMECDFSWKASAERYVELYRTAKRGKVNKK
jgi:starch synthase